ncbi:MAG: DMT family transporter [Desulfotignum sp.]|nr:DMT family transporter [Desulfotignum sp.]MCF8089043.1 DMT family transporter [Desulfotignum sp.]MCF8138307.1 DMT family transporter [Desulfotignum sp.]
MTSIVSLHPAVTAGLWMAGTLFSFAAMAVGGRELSRELSTFQILFFRSLTGLVIVTAFIIKTRKGSMRSSRVLMHLVRNIAHFGGQFGWFFGIAAIPLAEVFAIEFTVPVWTALLAAFLLRERFTGPRITAICLGLTGMLIILRPGAAIVHPAAIAVLLGAVCYGLSHTLTRKLAQTDSPLTILFYMTLFQLPMGAVPAAASWVIPSPVLWPWIGLVGVSALSGHFCMAKALSLADAAVVVPMDFLRLPLIALVGYLFYNEALDVFVFTGAVFMLAGNLVSIRAEKQTLVLRQ